jgi:hypothetical protein
MSGRKELPLGQGGSEGGSNGEQQQNGAGDEAATQAAEQEEETGNRRERGEREADPPEHLGRHKGSRITKESAASTHECSAEKQAEGEQEHPDSLPRYSLGKALP